MREPVTSQSDIAAVVHDAAMRRLRSFRRIAHLHEDLAQQVVVEFLATVARLKAEGGEPIRDPARWANQAAGNRAKNAVGREPRKGGAPLVEPGAGPDDRRGEAVPDPDEVAFARFLIAGVPVSAEVLVRAQLDVVRSVLDERERAMLELVAAGHDRASIAEQVGLADVDEVAVALRRARAKAREAVRAAGYDTPWEEHPRPYG